MVRFVKKRWKWFAVGAGLLCLAAYTPTIIYLTGAIPYGAGSSNPTSPWPLLGRLSFATQPVNISENAKPSNNADFNDFLVGQAINDVVTAGNTGGRLTDVVSLDLEGAPASGNQNQNYVAFAPQAFGGVNMGGASGNYYGSLYTENPVCVLGADATYYIEVTCAEVNVGIEAGGSAEIKIGFDIVEGQTDAVTAPLVDSALGISSTAVLGFTNAINISNLNGQYPVRTNGDIMEFGTATVVTAFDLSGISTSDAVMLLNPSGATLAAWGGTTISGSNSGIVTSNGTFSATGGVCTGNGSVVTTGCFLGGTGNPTSGGGSNGEFYFRSDCTHGSSDCIWHKESGTWYALN